MFLMPISLSFGFTGLLDQVITFSIFSGLLVYLLVGFMIFKFRKMYPVGTINRGYLSPWHPFPGMVLIVLTLLTFVGMYLGYWINLLSGFLFYSLASMWFVLHRYKFVDTNSFIKKRWPRPFGY